ncbi:MAG: hypothetical protein WBM76_15300, partial [Woeseiaceae bacterium]
MATFAVVVVEHFAIGRRRGFLNRDHDLVGHAVHGAVIDDERSYLAAGDIRGKSRGGAAGVVEHSAAAHG